jgi:hypothetical protein
VSLAELRIESASMPDWTAWEMDDIAYIDWQPIVEVGKAREFASRAASAEDA